MKQILIIFLTFCTLPILANDSIRVNLPADSIDVAMVDTLPMEDTIAANTLDTLVDLPLFFDEALAWLDTTECTSDTLITELPDSVYKARLQALPFVIEVPRSPIYLALCQA